MPPPGIVGATKTSTTEASFLKRVINSAHNGGVQPGCQPRTDDSRGGLELATKLDDCP
jgi:hypothetical protein